MRLAAGLALFALAAMAALPFSISAARAEPPEDDRAKAVAGTSRFTLDLYQAIRERDGNVFCSPLNIAAALEMAAVGARGETADQIHRTLGLDPLGERAPDAVGALLDSLRTFSEPPAPAERPANGADDDRQAAGLWTVNALWIDEREQPLGDFTAALERSFQAKPHVVDFAHSSETARATINRWVEDQTRDRIKNLLGPDLIGPDTAVVLTSAIYFKGFWVHPFAKEQTRDDQFHPTKNAAVPVKMMNQTATLPYFENDSFQAVSLPYKGGALSMLVLLPKAPDGLADLEASLTVETLAAATSKMRRRRVKLSLPRFASTVEFNLGDVLSDLGMPLAFQAGRADFSGITGSPDFSISAVVHKAFIEVEEKGTEAAAATGVVMTRSALIPGDEVVFRADRPFLHLIRDSKTGAILFIGRLSQP